MTPTAELDAPTAAAQLVSKPDASVLFMARRENLRLVKKSIRAIRGAEGEVLDQTLGETVQFRDGVLRVPTVQGAKFTLSNGESADPAEIIDWLERHRLKGDVEEGFWRVDPTAPPPSQEELEALQALAMDLDADGLREFIRQEQAGWGRETLLSIATGSIERIERSLKDLEARHTAQLDAARAEGEAAARKTPAKQAKPDA